MSQAISQWGPEDELRVKLPKHIANDLRKLRERSGLTQYELADQSGLTRSKIKRIEKGEVSTIVQKELDKIMSILTVPSSPAPTPKSKLSRPSRVAGESREARRGGPPPADPKIRAEVQRQVRASVLAVLRDVIGDSGRALVMKHELHDVTLGELYALTA